MTKTIANRLKIVLPHLIGEYQSAFVPGRLITDNALIAFDTFHYMRKKTYGKMGHVGIKVDMAKAYDRVEWCFLEKLLGVMGFPTHWISLISRCVSTVSFSILLNGFPGKPFNPERGLRHGDPLSPYLFILCAEVLSGLIIKAQERKALHGIKIARNAPEISHLLFADDSIFFTRATRQEIEQLMSVLSLY